MRKSYQVSRDYADFEWDEIISSEVDHIDISDILKQVGDDEAAKLLRVMFIGLTPKRILNINSRACWKTF